ncbi:hypothetical protein AB1N83_007050 [Pleurotus pulmonarius]
MLAKFLAVVMLILSAGSLVLSHPATARDVDVSDATFPGCNPEQIATLQRAIAVATLFQQDAWAYFAHRTANPAPGADLTRYTRWFGAYGPARYTIVYNRFQRLSTYPLNSWEYSCRPVLSPGLCGPLLQFATLAVTDSDQLNNATLIAPVEICKAFWSRNGSDDQNGQTLFHEATHFHSRGMLGTNHAVAEDYGTEYSLALARDAPTDAIRNADNYAYFAQYPVGP